MQNGIDLGENQLHAMMLRAATIVLCVLLLCATSCEMHTDYRAAQAIAKGADPVAVRCALADANGQVCALAAVRSAAK